MNSDTILNTQGVPEPYLNGFYAAVKRVPMAELACHYTTDETRRQWWQGFEDGALCLGEISEPADTSQTVTSTPRV